MMMIQFLKYLLNNVVGCIAANRFNGGFKLILQSLTQYQVWRVSTFLELILMNGPAPGPGNWPDMT